MKSPSFFLLFFAIMATISLRAQNWERLYGPGNAADFTQTPDGGFILVGTNAKDYAAEAFITKTDAEGDVEWAHAYDVGDSLDRYTSLQILDAQHMVAAGDFLFYGGNPERFLSFIHLLDAQGNLIKEVKLDPTPTLGTHYFANDVALTAQGLILFSVNASAHPQNPSIGNIFAYDSALELLWSVQIPVVIQQMTPLADGTVLISGSKNGYVFLCKMDASGSILWEKTYQGGTAFNTLTQDGNVLLAAVNNLTKVDPDGGVIWSKAGASGSSWVVEDQDGNLLVSGAQASKFSLNKFDAQGNLIWKKIPHASLSGTNSKAKPLVTSDGGYALAGNRNDKLMLMRSDTAFGIYRSWIKGTMFHDINDDCIKDASEKALKYFFATATDVNGTVWLEPFENGAFAFQVPSGDYEVAVTRRSLDPENWEPCPAELVTITSTTDTAFVAPLGAKSLVDCPRPNIRSGISKVRHCHDNQYNLVYYNLGTQKATDVKIEVELPDFLSYTGSSLPLIAQDGQKFTFLVGDLDIDEEGTATIDVFCSCDAEIGDVACSTFRITPDTCYATLPNWDHSIIKIDADFDASNVWFNLENIGTGDMANPVNYLLRRYCVSVLDQGNFQLDAGASTTITVPNNALAYRFEAENPGNQVYIPGNAYVLWRCLGVPLTEAWWNDDTGSPFYDLNCETVKNSFDPNDITVRPAGDGEQHYILASESELKYRIRFQNTGNDTAYVVSIRDTLPEQTSITTVVPGPSSHPYTFDIQHNVIKFLFQNINLPDSTANFDASQGYVEFTVKMKPSLLLGTRIENKAAIYFDLNAPVITNTALNTIHQPVFVAVEMPEQPSIVRVMPNPATDAAVFYFENPVEGTFYLMNTEGREIDSKTFSGNDFTLNCQNLPQGLYFFNIQLKGQPAMQGKLVVTR